MFGMHKISRCSRRMRVCSSIQKSSLGEGVCLHLTLAEILAETVSAMLTSLARVKLAKCKQNLARPWQGASANRVSFWHRTVVWFVYKKFINEFEGSKCCQTYLSKVIYFILAKFKNYIIYTTNKKYALSTKRQVLSRNRYFLAHFMS